ncbi:MAG TPA: cytochrome b N-terminal domain-containing protein [Planctomycetaceae bacterium]|nr:cytochrome b N-terminal domain-containing protein [Planctomycetaceae bacterium]
MNALIHWLDSRTGFKALMHEALYERVPGGARWRYVWGSTLVFTFVLQMITGFMLWTAYSPSTRTAWESVYYIQHEMYLGDIIRGLHHYAAQAMVVLMAIHLIQVIVDGAYKAPREMNFWLGIVLMMIVLGLSLTGYLLPWDQKGYYATQVTTNIMSVTPGVGPEVQVLAQGGSAYGHLTLTRFFAMHAGILPTLLVGFLALHIYVFRRHGLTVHNENHAPETTFWPDQVLKDAIACLAVLSVVLLLAIFRGAEMTAPADPAVKFDAARPEWYFLFLFQFLRFHAVESLGLTFGAIIVPGIIMGIISLMPITANVLGKFGHNFNRVFIWLLALGIAGLTGLAFYNDANDKDHQAALTEAHRDAERAVELASGPNKIPVEGAVSLLRKDPFTQGPRLFAQNCAVCHRYNGHDGRGSLVTQAAKDKLDPPVIAPPTAADLGSFGNPEWMTAIVIDYSNHFAWMKNAEWFKKAQEKSAAGESVDYINPGSSEMADWTGGNMDALKSPENADNLKALVAFLVSETGHSGTTFDATLIAKGRDLAINGSWAGALKDTSCAGCHDTIGQDFPAQPDDSAASGYPTLAKYGSAAWLKDFIRHPDAKRHYGSKNEMMVYSPQKLSDTDLDLLVRWMTHDYPPSTVHDYENQLEMLKAALAASAGSAKNTAETPSHSGADNAAEPKAE